MRSLARDEYLHNCHPHATPYLEKRFFVVFDAAFYFYVDLQHKSNKLTCHITKSLCESPGSQDGGYEDIPLGYCAV
jgi:hypothetical protein